MLKKYGLSPYIGEIVGKAVEKTLSDYSRGDLQEEDHITSTLITRIKDGINDTQHRGVHFQCIQAQGRGSNSVEHGVGADFIGIMQMKFPELEINKLFAAQVKKISKGTKGDFLKLDSHIIGQCEKMLSLTEEAIVVIISDTGIDAIDARSIYEMSKKLNQHSMILEIKSSFYTKTFQRYMQDVYETWQGDPRRGVQISSKDDLTRILKETQMSNGFAITASTTDAHSCNECVNHSKLC